MSPDVREQSFVNHAHRPMLAVVAYFFGVAGTIFLVGNWLRGWNTLQPGVISLAFAVLVLASISRVYITALQNRIIRLEMRVRLMDLLPKDQHPKISQLTTPQLVGLRFASDPELPALVDRAIVEHLSRDDIKRAIKNWVADWERT
jgi:hypothetical protein